MLIELLNKVDKTLYMTLHASDSNSAIAAIDTILSKQPNQIAVAYTDNKILDDTSIIVNELTALVYK